MCPESPRTGFFQRVLQHVWTDLAPLVSGSDAPPLSLKEAKLWALILSSRNVPYRMRELPREQGWGYTIQVQEWFAERAVKEITLYLDENRAELGTVHLPDLRPVSGMEPTLIGLALLVIFYWLYNRVYPGLGLYPELWVKTGSANGAAILSGEWWRTATALTLHADGPHVVGNAVIGGVFIWLASRRLGSGLAWFLTIASGMLGNLVNSAVLGVHHDAIGFSTATFGAAGLLAGIAPFAVGGGVHGLGSGEVARRFVRFVANALIPFGAGLGLLAMLGAGEKSDLGAHLFGFLVGVCLGCAAGLYSSRRGLPGQKADSVLYATAVSVPVLSWFAAWLA